jgi:hypothetical protein
MLFVYRQALWAGEVGASTTFAIGASLCICRTWAPAKARERPRQQHSTASIPSQRHRHRPAASPTADTTADGAAAAAHAAANRVLPTAAAGGRPAAVTAGGWRPAAVAIGRRVGRRRRRRQETPPRP